MAPKRVRRIRWGVVRRALRECRARRRPVVQWLGEDGEELWLQQFICAENALAIYVHLGEHVYCTLDEAGHPRGHPRGGTVRIQWRICFRG